MKAELVSAIVTTHKRRPEIVCRAIRSILSQTYENLEIIVVDDSPADYELRNAVCEAVSALSDKITYIKNEKNIGACASRNIGIAHSSGTCIAFLDDDDEWVPTKIEKQTEKMNGQAALVYCGYIRHDEASHIDRQIRMQYRSGMVYSELLYGNFIGGASFPLLKKEALLAAGGFDETLEALQDIDMWLRLARDYPVDYVPEPLVIYHYGEGEQISTNPRKKLNGLLQFNLKYAHELEKDKNLKWHRTQILPAYYARCGQLKKALTLWFKCSVARPWRVISNLRSLRVVIRDGAQRGRLKTICKIAP